MCETVGKLGNKFLHKFLKNKERKIYFKIYKITKILSINQKKDNTSKQNYIKKTKKTK